MESRYLNRFQKLNALTKEERKELFTLNGNRVLLEILPKREIKTASGLIISAPSDHVKITADATQAVMAIVLLTGEGYVDEDGNPVDMDVKPGNVVMVNEFGIKTFSTFPGLLDYTKNTLAMTSESEIQVSFPSMEAFERYEALLNG